MIWLYMLHYLATPHSTTRISPAEMLFNRKLQTKFPYTHMNSESKERKKICADHNKKSMLKEEYFYEEHWQQPKISISLWDCWRIWRRREWCLSWCWLWWCTIVWLRSGYYPVMTSHVPKIKSSGRTKEGPSFSKLGIK